MKIPIAPLIPPTHGPYSTAKTAGMRTAGKNPIPKKEKPAVAMPKAAYSAAHMPITAISRDVNLVFNSYPFELELNHSDYVLQISIPFIMFKRL
jgi:hypothetical protein